MTEGTALAWPAARRAKAQRVLALCLTEAGRLQEALAALDESVAAAPSTDATFLRIKCLALLGRTRDVEQALPPLIAHAEAALEM